MTIPLGGERSHGPSFPFFSEEREKAPTLPFLQCFLLQEKAETLFSAGINFLSLSFLSFLYAMGWFSPSRLCRGQAWPGPSPWSFSLISFSSSFE